MQLAVIDPKREQRKNLIDFIESYFRQRQLTLTIHEFETENDYLEEIKNHSIPFSIYFISISENELSGLDIGRKIRQLHSRRIIIFTTSSPVHASEAFRMQADGYLLMPLQYEDLEATLDKCIRNIDFNYKKIPIRSEYVPMNIPLKDILYIEVYNKTCIIHTNKREITSTMPLIEFERKLKHEGFLRCHKSYLVNMRYIATDSKSDFLLTNEIAIPISKRENLKLREEYHDWIWANEF
jgi:DNA-binding LytR/AlgR family response regulator